jgi:hypothetical protein
MLGVTSLSSPTFGNYYQSAISAGYSNGMAINAVKWFPKSRLLKLRQIFEDDPDTRELFKRIIREQNENPDGYLSEGQSYRIKYEQQKKAREIIKEFEHLLPV